MVEVYYPMSIESITSVSQPNDPRSGSVVAMLGVAIYWRELIQDILPERSGAITAVFEIGNQIFTYAVDGPKATFLGRGNLHDARYERMELKEHFLHVGSSATGGRTNTGLGLDDETRKASRVCSSMSSILDDSASLKSLVSLLLMLMLLTN